MHEVSQSLLLKKVGQKLQILDLPTDVISDIQKELQDSDLFSLCNKGPLQTIHKRNTFFKQNFGYTPPAEILIDYDKYNNPKTYQYIPICESLQNLYKHFPASFKFVRPSDDAAHPAVLSDIFDGTVFQKNALFLREERTFQIVLYQDAFEVVNPLGSARKKHKLVGVYYTLANFEADKRSNIDHMQLVLLCRETDLKEFTPRKVFRKLVEDLKKLEQHGVNVGDTFIKGTLFCIVGDNLGSHMIGGYQESFVAKYFCRYCEFSRDDGEFSLRGATRTVDKYKQTIQYIEENETSTHIGLKSDSLFNTLTFYHVAMPGLPPCLGHDLFEGIVAYDMALIINRLVDMNWFTYNQMNRKLETFIYSGLDALDKPPAFSPKAEKLGGQAVQNWVFLRLFSLWIGKYVKDADNCIWQLYLSLKCIVEIICSPKLPLSQIAYLNVCIEEYLSERQKLFPDTPMRPKHHYLLHYPELTIAFGPLIHLWTMRFESKHTYFKRCARQLHNYKHLSKTLACRHQLLQAFYASGSLFKTSLVIHDQAVPFHNHLYNQAIQDCVQSLGLNATNTQVSMKVSLKGIMYSPDEVVVLQETESGLLLGKINFLLVKGENVWLSVCSLQASPLPSYGLYMCDFSVPLPSSYQCINPLSLNNPFPIPVYQVDNSLYISLKTR